MSTFVSPDFLEMFSICFVLFLSGTFWLILFYFFPIQPCLFPNDAEMMWTSLKGERGHGEELGGVE